LNDIWQGPTWSSIEYGLKWKMSHYYVRHMYSPTYLLLKLTSYFPSITDDSAQIGLYLVNDFIYSSHYQVNCSIHSFDTFDVSFSVTYDVMTNSSGVQLINYWSYKTLLKQSGCLNSNECLMLCSWNNHNEIQT
jgi:beta-mannosidase